MTNQTKESYDELERRRRARVRRQKQKRQQKRRRIIYIVVRVIILSIVLAGIVWGISLLFFKNYVDLRKVSMPDWVEADFIEPNPYSRPGTEMKRADGIVVHYVANPGTSAKQNLNYFDSLKNQTGDKKISASSHFMIGLEGEILRESLFMRWPMPHPKRKMWIRFPLNAATLMRQENLTKQLMILW